MKTLQEIHDNCKRLIGEINDPNAWMNAPIKAEKWRNLYFMQDGSTFCGEGLHASEQAALFRAVESVNDAKSKQEFGEVDILIRGTKIGKLWSCVSHHIQMPVKS